MMRPNARGVRQRTDEDRRSGRCLAMHRSDFDRFALADPTARADPP